jgi:hypothetical protein
LEISQLILEAAVWVRPSGNALERGFLAVGASAMTDSCLFGVVSVVYLAAGWRYSVAKRRWARVALFFRKK